VLYILSLISGYRTAVTGIGLWQAKAHKGHTAALWGDVIRQWMVSEEQQFLDS
jgi:hypothetical protein|tara:strand:+ start:692 stop:850 length:159 start_codon:yes stop_codon:yes gene_type:complete